MGNQAFKQKNGMRALCSRLHTAHRQKDGALSLQQEPPKQDPLTSFLHERMGKMGSYEARYPGIVAHMSVIWALRKLRQEDREF